MFYHVFNAVAKGLKLTTKFLVVDIFLGFSAHI